MEEEEGGGGTFFSRTFCFTLSSVFSRRTKKKEKAQKKRAKKRQKTQAASPLLDYFRPRQKHLTLLFACAWSRDRIVERTNPFYTFSDHKKRVGSEFRSKVDKELSR